MKRREEKRRGGGGAQNKVMSLAEGVMGKGFVGGRTITKHDHPSSRLRVGVGVGLCSCLSRGPGPCFSFVCMSKFA